MRLSQGKFLFANMPKSFVRIRKRSSLLVASWLFALLLLASVGLLIYFALLFTNRIFISPQPNIASSDSFQLEEAKQIKRLQHLWTTPSP